MRGSDVVRKRKMISKAAHWTSNFFMKFRPSPFCNTGAGLYALLKSGNLVSFLENVPFPYLHRIIW